MCGVLDRSGRAGLDRMQHTLLDDGDVLLCEDHLDGINITNDCKRLRAKTHLVGVVGPWLALVVVRVENDRSKFALRGLPVRLGSRCEWIAKRVARLGRALRAAVALVLCNTSQSREFTSIV